MPTLALDLNKQKEFEDKVKKIKATADELTPGVIYLGHIPHGFYEDQIRQFFSQFGTVNKVRLSRSRKTAKSKGYAFVEFACDEVAKIAAETMNNYMMFGRLLKCSVIPKDRVHPMLWKGSDRKFKSIPWQKSEVKKQNKKKSKEGQETQLRNILKKERRKRRKMKDLGIDYDFPGYAKEIKTKLPKYTTFNDEDSENQE
ncbi:MKI67 FHA domain-interacting nucleolar phosphoprotein-like [Stylophora pistillata]|uniref:MKI67 FHA domain-interacting nucleolar phosphoprotein-like n=2 Tax=Stylophora pistillata TaxID=50429 RepID=A0A2B4SNN1_STYPI|nr:MKI67 FHA domain-interacting nucleolar phosphoprotein-like [Stylophora pistillata]